MPVKIQTEVDEFIFTYLIHLLFLHQRERNTRPELSHLIHMDEGMLSWSRNANKIDGVPLLSYLQSMVREFGIGMLISTTSVHLIDPLLKSNSFIRIALNVTDHMEAVEIARTFGLTMPQREYFSRGLTRGEAIIKFADEWTDPILATFSARHEPKTVSLAEWEAAKRRTRALIPPIPEPIVVSTVTASAKEERGAQPTPAQAPSSSPPRPVTAVVEKIVLNEHETKLLQDVAEYPLTLTTPSYNRCHFHWQQGDRAKQHLIALGFISAHAVIAGARRGKRGSALRVEQGGWA
jgi:hypothetical protein